jgi:alanine racemase
MQLKSRLIQVREVQKNETISYDRTFVAEKNMKVAAAPIGYVHGLGRSRSNVGWALVRNHKAPLLGRICMNLSLYDVTHIPDASPGDEIVILGNQGKETITAELLAEWENTIPYEILCHLGHLNHRIFNG